MFDRGRVPQPQHCSAPLTTGAATLIGPTAFGIDAALQVNGAVYGFTSANTVLSLNVANGNTTFVTNYDPNAMDITGAAATPEPASFGLVAIGIAASLIAGRRKFYANSADAAPIERSHPRWKGPVAAREKSRSAMSLAARGVWVSGAKPAFLTPKDVAESCFEITLGFPLRRATRTS
jgi:hypothetical protein